MCMHLYLCIEKCIAWSAKFENTIYTSYVKRC